MGGWRGEGGGGTRCAGAPQASGEELEGDDGVERGLPHHALAVPLPHRVGVVTRVVAERGEGSVVSEESRFWGGRGFG
jgi:hypothetical protein